MSILSVSKTMNGRLSAFKQGKFENSSFFILGLAHYYIIVACLSGLAATFMANRVVFSPADLSKS